MPSTKEEFERRREFVSTARWDEINERMRGLMEWMLSVPKIAAIVEGLEHSVSIDEILGRRRGQMPPPTTTPEEVIRVGVYLLRQVRGGHDFPNFILNLHVRPPYRSDHAQDITEEGLKRYVEPAFDYVTLELERLESGATAEGVLEERLDILFRPEFHREHPATSQRLRMAAETIARDDNSTEWSGVANSCRQAMLVFMSEMQQARSIHVTSLKGDDFKGHARAILKGARLEGRSGEALERLVLAAWDYAQSVTHKRPANRAQAQAVFTWTALSILELWNASNGRL